MALEILKKRLLNLQELNFNKNPVHVNKDLIGSIADPVNLSYYRTHEFYKLNTNIKENNLGNLSLLHANICLLQGNFNKLQVLLDNLQHEFDFAALSKTWYNEGNVTFASGLLRDYQKYEGIIGSSKKKGGCGVYVKDSIPYIVMADLKKSHKNNRRVIPCQIKHEK